MNTNSWLQTIIIAVGVGIAYWQLNRMNVQNKADFTYKVYKDLIKWLEKNKECRNWILKLNEKLKSNFEKWEFDDFLGYFVTIYALKRRKLIDKEMVYDLFSDYLISVYEANDFELKEIIRELREKEKKEDLYIEIEELYKEMKQREQNK
ncbi:MAG: hypothetical protein NC935_08525 [Candidatus Omnitrophica bacterium]|nr:hypothetical protein [Candidatus Omnitrophota bacterium]